MTLSEERIASLLKPYLLGIIPPATLYAQLGVYLDLLLRWNARTNLTAIRDPEEIVRRHFGESLFVGVQLAPSLLTGTTLLDFGSGAGFPGLPIQLLLPKIQATLSESQGKKAAFLQEAVRTLGLKTEIWAARVESMPSARQFDVVALRAVDNMENALSEASLRVVAGGILAALGGKGLLADAPETKQWQLPNSAESFLYLKRS